MISGIVPFEEIVQSIKDETGIENLRPLYEKIRRLMFRAERDIGYGGSVEIKKRTYKLNVDYNGKFFIFPEDFIEFEGIGQKGICLRNSKHTLNTELLRFPTVQKENTVLLYWGINTDEEGYPKVTRNHEEAVVAFIVWKLYTSKIFLGIGNMNANKNYQQEYEALCLASRGNDAMPTLEQWDDLGALSYTDRRILIEEGVHNYDYSEDVEESNTLNQNIMIKYWQLALGQTMEDIISILSKEYLSDKPEFSFEELELGKLINYPLVGRIAFAVTETKNTYYSFQDELNNRVDSAFDFYYFEDLKVKLYVSKNMIADAEMTFKIKNL